MHPSKTGSVLEPTDAIRQAIRFAMAAGASTTAVFGTQTAQAADEEKVEEVVITGSRIPRAVDEATASPITTIDSSTIAASGIQSTAELISQLPTVAGAATTAAVNNGGGFGEANIELRGLDAKRTLVLLNGRRIGVVGNSGAVDVNMIPVSIIDHIDVLKEGAGAVYGSDAIAGVVNIVTRTGVDGLELSGEFGQTTRSDGRHDMLSALWGTKTDKLDITVGASYSKQKAVYASARDFSKDALYLYSGSSGRYVSHAGSSRVPTGRATLPYTSTNTQWNDLYGCRSSSQSARPINVTRTPGTDGTSVNDYECLGYTYNYQPYNLIMTPQERGAVFTSGSYQITDDLSAYSEMLFNKTHSGFVIAPLPFDATADDVIISADNQYNPFGIDFGGLETTNSNYRTRFESLGTRNSQSDSDSKLINFGLRGKILDTGWNWDANLSYNRLDQAQKVNGYVYFPALQDAVGPSYQDSTGWHCGTDAAHEIAGCTPINLFDLDDPNTIAQLKNMATSYHTNQAFITKGASANVTGKLFALPAGAVETAFGYEYRKLETQFDADRVIQAEAPLYLKCLISNEACSGSSSGDYSSSEFYGEFFVPLLKNLPGAQALNVDLGVRYSDYSKFGSTTKGQAKIEYKPISDLLIRGTYAQVFRVPTLNDLYAAPLNTSATFADPCYGVTAAQITANPNLGLACENAATDGSFQYNGTAQVTGLILSNPDLKPEKGDVFTFGFVLQVPGVENLSFTVDKWNYDIKNLITNLDPNYSIQQCIETGAAAFCDLVTRYAAGTNQGQVEVFQMPTVNLGELKTDGIDVSLKYAMPETAWGTWHFGIDTTYINKYDVYSVPGAAVQHVAGTYDRQFGNYARWRGTASIAWKLSDFEGLLQYRYIHSLVVHDPATQEYGWASTGASNPDLQIPSIGYFDLTLGYTIAATKTKFQLGLQNALDKQPPILYMNNVTNANTDVSTYDTLGRRFFVTVNQKF